MMNCRSISQATWKHAREALVFFFSRRHGAAHAEDLAQETLTALWAREEFQFEKEEDFLRVCYGFANHVLQNARREHLKRAAAVAAASAATTEIQTARPGLAKHEMQIYLDEVIRIGRKELPGSDWESIQSSLTLDGNRKAGQQDPVVANKLRVRLHRARQRLADITGWRKA